MYESFFTLSEKPFNLTPDPKFLFLGKSHQEAFNLLNYGIQRREGFAAITGEVGIGKTTICRALVDNLTSRTRTALVLNPLLSETELLETILQEFGVIPQSKQLKGDVSKKVLIDILNEFLLKLLSKGETSVLLIDEAQNLSLSVLEQLRILSNLETEKEKLLNIVLIGQPELRQKLDSGVLRQLNQRISIRYNLQPFSPDETEAYVYHRLRVAGSRGGIVFTKKAIERIFRYSNGIPRVINLICDRSLLSGYISQSFSIDHRMVEDGVAALEGQEDKAKPRRARFF